MTTAAARRAIAQPAAHARAQSDTFRRIAAITAILSAPLAIGVIVLPFAIGNVNPEAMSSPALTLLEGAEGAEVTRWTMLLDMFGYYLLLAPAALFLRRWLAPKNADLANLYTVAGLAYLLIGAIGAAILAAVWPPLMVAYSSAAASEQGSITLVFNTITNVVYGGLWNILELIPGGIWWVGVGLMLWRERRVFATLSIVLGIAALVDAFGNIAGAHDIATIGLMAYLFLAPVWALWLGILVARGAGRSIEAA